MKTYIVTAGRLPSGAPAHLRGDEPNASVFLRGIRKTVLKTILLDYDINLSPEDVVRIGHQHRHDPRLYGRNWVVVRARNPRLAVAAVERNDPGLNQFAAEVRALAAQNGLDVSGGSAPAPAS